MQHPDPLSGSKPIQTQLFFSYCLDPGMLCQPIASGYRPGSPTFLPVGDTLFEIQLHTGCGDYPAQSGSRVLTWL